AGHDPQQRRLARTVGADHPDLGAGIEGQRDVGQHFLVGRMEAADPPHGEDELRVAQETKARAAHFGHALAMASGPSAYFRFWDHFDARSRTWSDGEPGVDLIMQMTRAQRRRTERELLARLDADPSGDGWVIDALGALRSLDAVPVLRQCLDGPVAEDA